MKKRNLIIRIIAIALCVVMVLGVVTVVFYAYAASPDAVATGSNSKVLWFGVAGAVAVAAIAACLISSKKSKPAGNNKDDSQKDDKS